VFSVPLIPKPYDQPGRLWLKALLFLAFAAGGEVILLSPVNVEKPATPAKPPAPNNRETWKPENGG